MTGFYIKERTAVRSEGLAAAKSVNAEKAKKADKRGKIKHET